MLLCKKTNIFSVFDFTMFVCADVVCTYVGMYWPLYLNLIFTGLGSFKQFSCDFRVFSSFEPHSYHIFFQLIRARNVTFRTTTNLARTKTRVTRKAGLLKAHFLRFRWQTVMKNKHLQ